MPLLKQKFFNTAFELSCLFLLITECHLVASDPLHGSTTRASPGSNEFWTVVLPKST